MRNVILKEILFVTHSSRDNRGKRVIVRIDNTENTLFPGEEKDPINIVLGLDHNDISSISRFFGDSERRLI